MVIHLGFGKNQEDAGRLLPHDWYTKTKRKNLIHDYMSELKKEQ